MSDYQYPGSDLDQAKNLLATIGSYWHVVYQGNDLLQSALHAKAQLTAQSHLDFLELIASISRFDVPVFHKENWHFLSFLQSEVNNFDALVPEYNQDDPVNVYSQNTNLKYGEPRGIDYSVPLPKGLVDFKVVMNRITEPSLTLIRDIDFYSPKPGVLTFRTNPFDNPLIPTRAVWKNGAIVDHEAGLWIFRGEWDWDTVYEQFGYVLKLRMQSSEGYKQLLNAIFDSLVEGTKVRDIQYAWSAITGIMLVREAQETVEAVLQDVRSEVVITDQHAYAFPLGSRVIVAVGDVLQAGDPVVDTLQFLEFNRGQVPPELQALAIGPGFLSTGFWGDLVFEDKQVDLIVEEDVDGFTKVSWELGGFPNDVTKFWDDVHTRGIAKNETLAQLLDVRSSPPDEPGPASLPAMINPLQFLCRNILRFHAYVVKIRSSHMGKHRLGIQAATNLRRIVPPHTAMIVLVELEHSDEPIMMDGPGTENRPGYQETQSVFPMMVTDEVLPSTLISERIRFYQISGKCE